MRAIVVLALAACCSARAPNIVFMVLDDAGFNDVSLHGSAQVPTPHIDAIARAGVRLNRYYTQPVCSPTRATLMTGRHAIHHGVYLPFDHGNGASHLNLSFTLLPAYLKAAANYSTRALGKWHLGGNTVAATPTGRGFDFYSGYWCGALDYVTHTVSGPKGVGVEYDFHETSATGDDNALVESYGDFSTRVFAAAAVDAITQQGAAGPDAPPLFLLLTWQNIHWPLQAPPEYVSRFANVTGGDNERNFVAAMISFVDDAIGNVTRAITTAGLDDDTIVIVVSDNVSGSGHCPFPRPHLLLCKEIYHPLPLPPTGRAYAWGGGDGVLQLPTACEWGRGEKALLHHSPLSRLPPPSAHREGRTLCGRGARVSLAWSRGRVSPPVQRSTRSFTRRTGCHLLSPQPRVGLTSNPFHHQGSLHSFLVMVLMCGHP